MTVTDRDQPEMSSEEMIRRARRDLEEQGTPDGYEPTAASPDAAAAGERAPIDEPITADPDGTEPTNHGMAPPPPPAAEAQDVPRPAPAPPDLTPQGRSPARTWVIVAGVLVFGVGALVLMALIRGTGTVSSIDAGDCFQDPGSGEISRLDTVECTEPHDFESIGRIRLDDGPYPGDIGIVVGAVEKCLTLFEPYSGVAFDESGLLVDAFVPTPRSWDDGDREALCVVFQADDDFTPVPISGSVRTSG